MRKLLTIFLGSLTLTASAFSYAPKETKDSAEVGATILEQVSDAFTQVADKAMPATVSIKTIVTVQQSDVPNPFEMFGDDFFRRFHHPFEMQPRPQQQIHGGSGFLITSDGYIVTNNHVVKDATEIFVTLNDGREYEAKVKGTDDRTDLALIKIEEKELPYLTFGDSENMKPGAYVIAIGNPFGFEGTLSVGVVSAKGRQELGIVPYEDFIQHDAVVNLGNSGGPLLNVRGEVIGINTAILSRSGGYMGISLAIPSKIAQNVIDQIMGSGSVKRSYIGVILQPIDKELHNALGLEKQEGIIVSEVVKDSPAAKAGLQQGDIILQYNGQTVKNVAKFRNEIAHMSPGSEVKLLVLRNNKQQTIPVTLASQTDSGIAAAELTQKLGLEIDNLTPDIAGKLGYSSDVNGVVVTRVKQGSPAAMAGIRPQFVITGVATSLNNPKWVKNITEFDEALRDLGDKKHIILIVRHQNFQKFYTIKIN